MSCALDISEYQLAISLRRYGFNIIRHIGFLGVSRRTTLEITQIYATYNDCSCPIIVTGGITPWFECHLKTRYVDTLDRSGKAIRGFPGHLSGSGRQLLEIDIDIRFIVQF